MATKYEGTSCYIFSGDDTSSNVKFEVIEGDDDIKDSVRIYYSGG
jgi:hypothetical protein